MIDSSKYYVRRGFFYLSYRGWQEQAGLSGSWFRVCRHGDLALVGSQVVQHAEGCKHATYLVSIERWTYHY